MQKAELRKLYKQKRKELSEKDIEIFQKSIYAQVFKYDFSEIHTIHIFLPITKQKEINTYPIIDFLRQQEKQIVISKSNFTNHTLQHFIFEEQTELVINEYGIPEPVNAKKIHPQKIDLVFIPLLISDQNNYRIGYGKGFYDRFLVTCPISVKKIGLNFFPPIFKIEDCNKFDVPLDAVIYPKL